MRRSWGRATIGSSAAESGWMATMGSILLGGCDRFGPAARLPVALRAVPSTTGQVERPFVAPPNHEQPFDVKRRRTNVCPASLGVLPCKRLFDTNERPGP